MPFCHTIKVVISPNGLNAPPEFEATTIFMQLILIKFLFLFPIDIIIELIIIAVVKLSAIGDIKNDKDPVNQKIFFKLKFKLISLLLIQSKKLYALIALIYIIATNKNIKSSEYSNIFNRINVAVDKLLSLQIYAITNHIMLAARITGFDFLNFVNSSNITKMYDTRKIIKVI